MYVDQIQALRLIENFPPFAKRFYRYYLPPSLSLHPSLASPSLTSTFPSVSASTFISPFTSASAFNSRCLHQPLPLPVLVLPRQPLTVPCRCLAFKLAKLLSHCPKPPPPTEGRVHVKLERGRDGVLRKRRIKVCYSWKFSACFCGTSHVVRRRNRRRSRPCVSSPLRCSTGAKSRASLASPATRIRSKVSYDSNNRREKKKKSLLKFELYLLASENGADARRRVPVQPTGRELRGCGCHVHYQ